MAEMEAWLVFEMRKAILLFLLLAGSSFPHVNKAYFDRPYYLDELIITKQNVSQPFSWFNPWIIKTKWGVMVADDVHVFLTADMLKLDANYKQGKDKSKIVYLISDNPGWVDAPNEAKCYNATDANKYPQRIASYINIRQKTEVLKVNGNKLILGNEGARNATRVMIDNLHSIYPCIHVVETNDGWRFDKP